LQLQTHGKVCNWLSDSGWPRLWSRGSHFPAGSADDPHLAREGNDVDRGGPHVFRFFHPAHQSHRCGGA